MPFGIPGSDNSPTSNEPFLGRIQYDARVGFWKPIKRVKNGDGPYVDQELELVRNPTLLMDFGSLEAGYIKLATPPDFSMLVPMGQPWPPYPSEMVTDAQGKQRKAYLPGVRLKVASPKVFGDEKAYYFSVNAKTALDPMFALYKTFQASPEAGNGLVPMVACTGTTKVEFGQSAFHAPNFEIVGWKERIPEFGERTVPPPMGTAVGIGVQGVTAAATSAQASTATPVTPAAKPAAAMPDQW